MLIAAALAGGAYLTVSRMGKPRVPSAEASPVTPRPGIPVAAVQARLGDFNRYLSALGTVTPFNTVTVKSRVDGQIISVAFREGQIVHQGDLLLQIDPRPFQVQLEQAQGQLARDRANLTNAKITLARDKTLLAEKVIAAQDYDNQAAVVGQYEGTLVADQAAIDNAKLQLTYSRITAPITGRIGLRLVDPGNIVHATDTQGLAVITQLRPIAVLFNIPEDDLPRVRQDVRSGAPLLVEAFDRTLKTKLATGTLLTYDNQIDPATGTVRLKASFPNDDYSLFPNQFVNVRMLVDTERNAILIPTAAVQRSALGTFVYVVKPDDTAEVRKVEIGATEGELTAVKSGVQAGERLVVEGADRLAQGSKVRVRMAANNEIVSPAANQAAQSASP
ncbi:MAG TPA: MdtA/MuxA family multidrug efflux RND transporter periplasmic adaptor subunit [Bryobacteraceae bacterium]|nr:MdtA/MuxA family multidrug efflux RND transporter periplasmic adaptor subunit [Bryobacteraceae bacterium]